MHFGRAKIMDLGIIFCGRLEFLRKFWEVQCRSRQNSKKLSILKMILVSVDLVGIEASDRQWDL